MNRQRIEYVRRLAREVYTLCDAALDAINLEARATAEFMERDYERPSDRSSGSAETATLRRRSMDLTRALADMRRSS